MSQQTVCEELKKKIFQRKYLGKGNIYKPVCAADSDDANRGASDTNGDNTVDDNAEEAKKDANQTSSIGLLNAIAALNGACAALVDNSRRRRCSDGDRRLLDLLRIQFYENNIRKYLLP